MSPANRSRRRGGNAGKGKGKSGGGGGGSGNRNQNRNRKKAPGKGPNRDFWGDKLEAPDVFGGIHASNDPTAMIRSLGDPPLRGHEPAAQQYFDVVYRRASSVAYALAAASGVLEPTTDD